MKIESIKNVIMVPLFFRFDYFLVARTELGKNLKQEKLIFEIF